MRVNWNGEETALEASSAGECCRQHFKQQTLRPKLTAWLCAGDPIGGCSVTPDCFAHMTALLQPIAPLAVLLEVSPAALKRLWTFAPYDTSLRTDALSCPCACKP